MDEGAVHNNTGESVAACGDVECWRAYCYVDEEVIGGDEDAHDHDGGDGGRG